MSECSTGGKECIYCTLMFILWKGQILSVIKVTGLDITEEGDIKYFLGVNIDKVDS